MKKVNTISFKVKNQKSDKLLNTSHSGLSWKRQTKAKVEFYNDTLSVEVFNAVFKTLYSYCFLLGYTMLYTSTKTI